MRIVMRVLCVLIVSIFNTEESWVMNSGYPYYTCSRKEYFETLKLKEGGVVHLGYKKAFTVHDIGTIKLKMFGDRDFLLHNMNYVLDLKQILLSISMVDDIGHFTRVEH